MGSLHMQDADAGPDGHICREGVASIILKKLSVAILDGDHVECLVWDTGANQNGYSDGITVPSTKAQAASVQGTYKNGGLDPENNIYDYI